MLGYYKKTRKEIVKYIKKCSQTSDNLYICKNFPIYNNTIGNKKDENFTFDRIYFDKKIIFSEEDISAYLEQGVSAYNVNEMKRRDEFVENIIKDFLDYNINDRIPGQYYNLGELIDSSIFYFNYKFSNNHLNNL